MGVYEKYKRRFNDGIYRSGNDRLTIGEIVKIDSDNTMNETWWNDPQSQIGYLYDWYHDDNKTILRNLRPKDDLKKIPIDVKFIKNTYQSLDKDIVTRHLLLRPGQKCNVDYYNDLFERQYDARFPVGLYIDLVDSSGQYNRWLVVRIADYHDGQFPKYEVLPCDYVFQYVYKGIKYNVAGCLRSQSSYNSGVWTDYRITSIEDQQKFLVPMNRDTEKIFYNQRMIIDVNVETEPRTWVVTKINRLQSNGVCMVTLAQDLFDTSRDYIEKDDYGHIVGKWADWFPKDLYSLPSQDIIDNSILPDYYMKLSYAGIKPVIKIGGSYKTITAKFYDKHDNEINDIFIDGWNIYIDGVNIDDIENNPILVNNSEMDDSLSLNIIRIKYVGSDDYLGKLLKIVAVKGGLSAEQSFEIVGL